MGYTCQTIEKKKQTKLSNGRKCHDTQICTHLQYAEKSPQRGWELQRGVFISITVLKDVRDTMNLRALQTSCKKKKKVYITSGHRIHRLSFFIFLRSYLNLELFNQCKETNATTLTALILQHCLEKKLGDFQYFLTANKSHERSKPFRSPLISYFVLQCKKIKMKWVKPSIIMLSHSYKPNDRM